MSEKEPLINAKEVEGILEDCLYRGEEPNYETREDTVADEYYKILEEGGWDDLNQTPNQNMK